MNKKIIDSLITIPMVINVLKQDKETFKDFRMYNAYINKLNAVIDQLHNDFYKLKRIIINDYHLDIKKINSLEYKVDDEIINYTSSHIKSLATEILDKYLLTVPSYNEEIDWY